MLHVVTAESGLMLCFRNFLTGRERAPRLAATFAHDAVAWNRAAHSVTWRLGGAAYRLSRAAARRACEGTASPFCETGIAADAVHASRGAVNAGATLSHARVAVTLRGTS